MGFNRDMLPDPTAYFEAEGLTLKGPSPSKWKTTRCDFHGGSDSMRVNTASGAFKCMACDVGGGDVLAFEMLATGAEFIDAAKALGAWVDDGKHPVNTKPTTLSPRAALEVLALETMIVSLVAADMVKGAVPTGANLKRLHVATGRINHLAGEFAP